jgi:hypothetical protein
MWADTLLSLERGHLLRLALWAGACTLSGTSLLAWLLVRRTSAPLLRHFAIQTATWGAVNLAIVAWAWQGLAYRDYAAAQRLLNVLWLNTGLDAGYAAVGVTLAVTGGVGAGLGVLVQGVALALLDLRLIAVIGPLQ